MNRLKAGWLRLAILLLILALCGCAIKNSFPTYPVPQRPEIRITTQGEHCLTDAELRNLDSYVIKLEALVEKYECEIILINGGTACPNGR